MHEQKVLATLAAAAERDESRLNDVNPFFTQDVEAGDSFTFA